MVLISRHRVECRGFQNSTIHKATFVSQPKHGQGIRRHLSKFSPEFLIIRIHVNVSFLIPYDGVLARMPEIGGTQIFSKLSM